MLRLFHASLAGSPDGRFSHFGTLKAATHRCDSVFAHSQLRTYDGQKVLLMDENLCVIGTERPEDSIRAFATFLEQKYKVYEVLVDIKNPLEIHDCWEEDPIASAAMDLFKTNEALPKSDRKELEQLFAPFDGLIYPKTIEERLSNREIADIKRKFMGNKILGQELEKRKQKLGPKKFAVDRLNEMVWLDLSLKLCFWATRKGYDGYMYKNEAEGEGDKCYVTFVPKQVQIVGSYSFDAERFLSVALPDFPSKQREYWKTSKIKKENIGSSRIYTDGFNAENFWIPIPETPNIKIRVASKLNC